MAEMKSGITTINELATTTMHFDYQIHPENEDSVQNIVSLKTNCAAWGSNGGCAKAYGISLTTNDVTDPEETGRVAKPRKHGR